MTWHVRLHYCAVHVIGVLSVVYLRWDNPNVYLYLAFLHATGLYNPPRFQASTFEGGEKSNACWSRGKIS